MLYGINSNIPPLFGDLKILTNNYFIIANCGASSAFYTANSNDPKESLSKAILQAQCQGKSGGAFGYSTPKTTDEATYARITRVDSDYYLQIGTGKIIAQDKSEKKAWGTTWPHTAVELKVPEKMFLKAIGTNHLSLTLGNYVQEMKFIAKLLNMPLIQLQP